MPDKVSNSVPIDDIGIARRVEYTVGRLDSLSTLPSVAALYLPRLIQVQFRPSSLAEIIESDPALTAKILSLIGKLGVSFPPGRFSLRQSLDKLPPDGVRDAILSIKVSNAFELGKSLLPNKRGLLLHSLAVACCAGEIAEAVSPQIDPELSYCAGLLHDIGKMALEEAMPKSFVKIIEEAKSSKECSCVVEQNHLGFDHTILGKRLAQKWQLPEPVILAIWLHHNQTLTVSQDLPETRIAAVVQLADSIARESGIGVSGSFDVPRAVQDLAKGLEIDSGQLQEICRRLHEEVEQKTKLLRLDMPNAIESYCKAAHASTARLARQHSELSRENRRLQSDSSHLDFTTDFLLDVSSSAGVLDIAENFAARWQKFYQTGMVFLYLAPLAGSQMLETVVVEKLGRSRLVSLNIPVDTSAVPKAIVEKFAILSAHDHIDWLLDQLDVDFDEHRTRLLPLLSTGRAIGAIAFELHYPSDAELFAEKFSDSASIAAAVLNIALAQQRQQDFAEHFARLISPAVSSLPSEPIKEPAQNSIDALAEMAAGAAHELNNPLTVISGRAQLLADAESDKEKREILEQIYENSREASELIEDLMSFAEPRQPRPSRTNVKQLIDEAVQLTIRKINRDDFDIQIKVAEGTDDVFVDSAQIASAVANIISNAIESYGDKAGVVEITSEAGQSGELVKLMIRDHGCGMDAETLKKATLPFFSAKEAGRKRGMGLAYAARFIQLNKGTLNITSEPNHGTTVTICLPAK
jgi:putative nucleotidyltransferase with HDIG domain